MGPVGVKGHTIRTLIEGFYWVCRCSTLMIALQSLAYEVGSICVFLYSYLCWQASRLVQACHMIIVPWLHCH